jgi:hypothetical protein
MSKKRDKVGLLTRDQARAEYERRIGLPPMEDPPACWANMASWMADDARSVTAYIAWFRGLEEPPARFAQRPHVAPIGRRKLVIDVVPKDLEAVYAMRRLGLVHTMKRHFEAMNEVFKQLNEYEQLLRDVQLVDVGERRGRPSEWGVDAFAFTFPYLWARHGERPALTNEIVALAARALVIDDEDLEHPTEYWGRRRRRLRGVDPSDPSAGPEVALIRMVQREHGDRWEAALRDLLHQGVHRDPPEEPLSEGSR